MVGKEVGVVIGVTIEDDASVAIDVMIHWDVEDVDDDDDEDTILNKLST